MAVEIDLRITASSPEELQAALYKLAGKELPEPVTAENIEKPVWVEQSVSVEEPKPTRTRRTKAEMAAAAAAEAPAVRDRFEPDNRPAPKPEPVVESPTTLTEAEARRIAEGVATVSAPSAAAAQAAALADEPNDDPLSDAPLPSDAEAPTIDDVRKIFIEMREKRADNPGLTGAIIKEFGHAKLLEVEPSEYAALIARAKKEMPK